MALNSAGIASGIASLTISGVTVKGLSNIPDTISVSDCPIMFPDPDNWMQGGIGSENGEGQSTFGAAADLPMWEFLRAFGYLYLHAATGQEIGLSAYMAAISANIDAISAALTTLNVSGVDVQMIDVTGLGTYTDQAGNAFYGCRISVACHERVNA